MFSERPSYGKSGWKVVPVLVFVSAFAGCGRQSSKAVQRIAIPPFENLTGDRKLDWMSKAASAVLAAEIEASPAIHPVDVDTRRDAALVRATHVLHGNFSIVRRWLFISASLERLDAGRMEQVITADGPVEAGILPLIDRVARRLEPRSGPSSPIDAETLRLFGEGLSSREPEVFGRAVARSPGFGAAYIGWVEALLARGDGAGARAVLQKAERARLADVDRARLALLDSTMRGDPRGRASSLRGLRRLTPADADVARALGASEAVLHRYTAAVDTYRRATELDPMNALLWNDYGYAAAFARDLKRAAAALREYQRLAPAEINPLDSLGDVHFYLGEFGEAGRFYREVARRNAAFLGGAPLYKAAWARRMAGDAAGAGELFEQYMKLRRAGKDPLADYREAQWRYLAGRREQAIEQLTGFVRKDPSPPEAVSEACSQLSAWFVAAGDRRLARVYADQAAATAVSPSSKALAAINRFLSEPAAAPDELAARARQRFTGPGDGPARRLALSYALLLEGSYSAASPLLGEAFRETSPMMPNHANILLAWALVGGGRAMEAADLLSIYWMPQPGGDHPFVFLAFPRVFQLRSTVLEKQGRRNEARQALALFRKFSVR